MNKNEIKIKKTILQNLDNSEKYKIFLFGSRAKWNYKNNSDYDIWILWEKKIDFIKLIRLKSKLNELPYIIDIVDFQTVSDDFKEIALKKIKKWN